MGAWLWLSWLKSPAALADEGPLAFGGKIDIIVHVLLVLGRF
jgi:hypothetical protein